MAEWPKTAAVDPPAGRDQQNGKEKKPSADPEPPPGWIAKLFRSKQYELLMALWDKNEVSEADLITALDYKTSLDPEDTLRRRVTETIKSLCERSKVIGEHWTIRERTRNRKKSYYLDRQK